MAFKCNPRVRRALLAVCWTLSLGASRLLAVLPGESPLTFGGGPGQSWDAPHALPEAVAEDPLDFAEPDASLAAAREAETVHERLAETGGAVADEKTPPAVLKATWPDRRAVRAGPVYRAAPISTKGIARAGTRGPARVFRSGPAGSVRLARSTVPIRADYFSIRNGYIQRPGHRGSFVSRPFVSRPSFARSPKSRRFRHPSFHISYPPGPLAPWPGVSV